MELGLKGRTAVITGASRGIGKACASALAAEGANVVLLARGREALDKTADEIRASGADVLAISTDVSDTASVNAAWSWALAVGAATLTSRSACRARSEMATFRQSAGSPA